MSRSLVFLFVTMLFACGGGAGGDGGPTVSASGGGCSGACAAATLTSLTVAEVEGIVSKAVQEAQARATPATIAVVDRSGNVLAVYRMTGAAATFTIDGGRGVVGGLEGIGIVPSEYAAISKALTGAYLSSEGNAFSTRTASQIVQENFNPGATGINQPGGPLFGVQFSSLSCSDVVSSGPASVVGPRPSPLGLSADPGGLPLYKNGTVVGGIGIISDGVYGLDREVIDIDQDRDEIIAVAGARGFDAPTDRRADRISAGGITLRYVDSEGTITNPGAAPAIAPAGSGVLVAVPTYKPVAAVSAGVAFSSIASGFRIDTTTAAFTGLNAYVLDNGAGVNRYPPIAGTDALLTQAEVTRILAEAIKVANRARAQIRQPLGSPAQVTISVVDTNAAVLGVIRTQDAPVFGTDVAVQKARSALLFSRTTTAAALNGLGAPITTYVTAMQALLAGSLANGIAYSNRAIGNLARPFLPDGINGNGPGPLSKAFAAWSPFSTGLQLDLVQAAVVANIGAAPLTVGCSTVAGARNGIQIFPGSVPIYRGAVLVGAIGISGDGIDQDDMVAFLGLANAGALLGTGIANAPAAIRADQLGVTGGQLRYVSCPFAPFLDSTATNVCDGI